MRVGIVGYWFNRGQATISRHVRDIVNAAGHHSFVFARPTRATFGGHGSGERHWDVWKQESITLGKSYRPERGEYLSWAKAHRLDAVFFFQNYEFDEIKSLRDSGVKTIGAFVWEDFATNHVDEARRAFSRIYSLTSAEQARYERMGVASEYISWGCHPELLARRGSYSHDGPLVFIGGWMSARKPLGSVLEAYRRTGGSDTPLILKSQRKLRQSDLLVPDSMDEIRKTRKPPHAELKREDVEEKYGVIVIEDDISFDEYLALLSAARALICPSRWEGLGLHFFEAMALGIPVLTSDIDPIRDFVVDGVNGILVSGRDIGQRKNGIPAVEPSISDLSKAIRDLESNVFATNLSFGMCEVAKMRPWTATEDGFLGILESDTQ